MKKKIIFVFMAAIMLTAFTSIIFKAGEAQGATQTTKFEEYQKFAAYSSDDSGKPIDMATSIQVIDPETRCVYFAHTECVQVVENGKKKNKNVLIIDCPRYYPDGGIAVVKK